MGKRRRNRLLVPEAREALDALMNHVSEETSEGTTQTQKPQSQVVNDVANSLGIPYTPNGDNGNLTTRQAGRIGGKLGGTMVQKLVQLAEQSLTRDPLRNNNPQNKPN